MSVLTRFKDALRVLMGNAEILTAEIRALEEAGVKTKLVAKPADDGTQHRVRIQKGTRRYLTVYGGSRSRSGWWRGSGLQKRFSVKVEGWYESGDAEDFQMALNEFQSKLLKGLMPGDEDG